jgi:hypothetical protein
VAQLREGLGLDLADALPRQVELTGHLLEGQRPVADQAEPKLEDSLLSLGESGEHPPQLLSVQGDDGGVEGRLGVGVLDEVGELGVAVTDLLAMPVSSASSATEGSRPNTRTRRAVARDTWATVSTMCTGTRIVRLLSAMARLTAWRIHHVA